MSVQFVDTDDVISVGDVSNLNFERTDSFSASGWVYVDTNAPKTSYIKKKENSGNERGWSVGQNDYGLYFILQNQDGVNRLEVTSNAGIPNEAWFHFAVTYDGYSDVSGVNMYVNSVHSENAIIINNLSSTIVTTEPVEICSSDTSSFLGRIHRLAVYNRVLTQDEINDLYNDGYVVSFDTLSSSEAIISYWEFGDGYGDSFPTIADQIGSNDGTMTNMTSEDIVNDKPEYLFDLPEILGNLDGYKTTVDDANNVFVYTVPSDGYGGGGINIITYYTMRGESDPGPGFVYWTVIDAPDFEATQAPSSVVTNSTVIYQSWVED